MAGAGVRIRLGLSFGITGNDQRASVAERPVVLRALTTERYKRGDTEFRVLLDEQRWKYHREEQAAIAAEAAVLRYVAFYKARWAAAGSCTTSCRLFPQPASRRRGLRPLDSRLALTPTAGERAMALSQCDS
jgi:hypothetical protein